MIKIEKLKDSEQISDRFLQKWVYDLVAHLTKTFGVDDISSIGAIFIVENKTELEHHTEFLLSSPIKSDRFEWFEDIGNGYLNGTIIIDNERAINLIGKKEVFEGLADKDDII